jgi:hypothetical protein
MPDTSQTIIGYSPATAHLAFHPPGTVSPRSIRRALASRALVSHRIGRARVVLLTDLRQWAESAPEFQRSAKNADID